MLTLICGIPNAGKTTYSKQYENVLHLDEINNRKKILDIVSKSDDICVEGIYINHRDRRDLVNAYHGDKKVCVWLNISVEESLKRETRKRSKLIIENCSKLFENPSLSEGWDEIIIISENGTEYLR